MTNSYHTFFLNLANKLKISIVTVLKDRGELSVGEIVKSVKAEQSKVSHALSSLKCCKIVLCRKDGKRRMYSLNKHTILPILEIIDRHSKDFCKVPCSKCKRRAK